MAKPAHISKRHHYVPKVYLRGFAKNEKFINVVPLDSKRRGFSASLDKIALENDYNTLTSPAIFERADEAEHQLSTIETSAAPIIRKIRERDFRLNFEEREHLSRFISIQAHRGPNVRANHEKFLDAVTVQSAGMSGPDELEEFVRSYMGANYPEFNAELVWESLKDPNFDIKNDLRLQHLQNTFISAEAEVPFLLGREWTFFYFERKKLITSDSPLSMFAPDEPAEKADTTLRGAGALLFPLSRSVALHLGRLHGINCHGSEEEIYRQVGNLKKTAGGEFDRVLAGTSHLANQFNVMTAFFAEREVFRHPEDSQLDALIFKSARRS